MEGCVDDDCCTFGIVFTKGLAGKGGPGFPHRPRKKEEGEVVFGAERGGAEEEVVWFSKSQYCGAAFVRGALDNLTDSSPCSWTLVQVVNGL